MSKTTRETRRGRNGSDGPSQRRRKDLRNNTIISFACLDNGDGVGSLGILASCISLTLRGLCGRGRRGGQCTASKGVGKTFEDNFLTASDGVSNA